jgi:hypothetical protein
VIEDHARLTHPPERVFEFLSDLRNHWRLEDAFIELGGLEGDEGHGPTGGRIRIRGPLGLSREAKTRVLEALAPGAGAPGALAGRAEVGSTIGRVGWDIRPSAGGGSEIRLWAEVERASLPDRVLLGLGGKRWLGRIFERTVANLGRVLDES